MMQKSLVEIYKLFKQEVAYIRYDYEECVFKIVSSDKEMKEAWVKFHGERPYKLKLDSRLLFEAMVGMDVITEEEFKDF